MKGLLLKDWYMTRRYCRSYFVIIPVFIAVSCVNPDNTFFIFYPCILAGMIPITLLSYDERSGWTRYSCSLPYTRKQIVSSKYVIGLIIQAAVLALSCAAQLIRGRLVGGFFFEEFAVFIALMLCVSLLYSALLMPFIFKFGVEKGRIAYFVILAVVLAGSVVVSRLLIGSDVLSSGTSLSPLIASAAGTLFSAAFYALSWFLSVRFYKKREL